MNHRVAAWLAGVLSIPFLASQDQAPPRFRIGVDAVRIDAVVTDRDGRIVPDLAAEDFEVLQDGKRQPVTFAQFVSVGGDRPPAGAVASAPRPVPDADTPPIRPPAVEREQVQRAIAIVVDDLTLSVESLYYAKRALNEFIDRGIEPGDLVAVVRTGGSLGGLEPFTTDRRRLRAAVDTLRWNGFSRSGVESFDAVEQWTTFDERTGMSDVNDFKTVNAFRAMMRATGTLGALHLIIRSARDLPGRKAIMFVSEGFSVLDRTGQLDTRVRAALDRTIDQATRAGVVIYSLDARGLQTGGMLASDNLKRPDAGASMEQSVRSAAGDRGGFLRDSQEGMRYLAEQTGGFAILDNNGLARGLDRISRDVRDYYVIGYVPADGTFVGPGKKPEYHKINVKVHRQGLRVRTRKEFLGVSDPEPDSGPMTPGQQLIAAAVSPFTRTEIPLATTILAGFAPERGMFVRTLLHIDARALTFTEGQDGKKAASADVLGMAFDGEGTEVAHLSTGFSVGLTSEASEDALRDGLVYTLRVPIAGPGAYQLRFAVRDRATGRLGTAGDFVEMPDIPHGQFALSGIVLRTDGGRGAALDEADQITVSPSQALRSYPVGTRLGYAYEIYNASQAVKSTTSIWRGAEKVFEAPADTLVPPASRQRIAAAGELKLGDGLPRGRYVLQVAGTTRDARAKGLTRTAVQRIDFDVR